MNELQKIESFRYSLAIAETFEEISLISSAADAAAEFAKKEKMSLDKQNEIGLFRIEVAEKKAKWLNDKYPNGAVKGSYHGNQYKSSSLPSGKTAKMPVSKYESAQVRLIKRKPEIKAIVIEKIIEAGDVITPNKVAAGIKKIERAAMIETQRKDIANNAITEISGLYDIISVDPPWNYGREYDPENSRVANPYPEMKIDEIFNINLPLKKDAIVFLWTTHKFLPDAFNILKHWGLDYKVTIVWNKENLGMGHWFRMQCVFCLFAIKGTPFWNNTIERDIISESRREHSRKPDSFFEMVNRLHGGRKLEYFAREKRNGWDVFGNDIKKF
jgi:N6-adenosine-specific RNA methylase IME4